MKEKTITIENGVVSIPISVEIWMTQHQLADLFGCFTGKISANIRSILKIGVLEEANVCRTCHYKNGSFVEQYNLEMITALSFRIKSRNAELFRDFIMKKAIANHVNRPILIIGDRNNYKFSPN